MTATPSAGRAELPTAARMPQTAPKGAGARAPLDDSATLRTATVNGWDRANTSGEVPMHDLGLDRPVGALDRGLAILKYLSTAGEAPIATVATAISLSRSTTYRLMDRLHQWGLVEANPTTGHWRLGPEAAKLAMAALQSTEIVCVGPELLRLLAQQTCETVGLAMFNTHEMIFIYREQGSHPVIFPQRVGSRRPLHCTAIGKAYLAALPVTEQRSLLRTTRLTRYTAHTITSPARLDQELRSIRQRGWSEDHGEFSERIMCCGAAVFDRAGQPVAAISVAGPSERMQLMLSRVGPMVASTAQAISRRLGGPAQEHPRRHDQPAHP